MQSKALKAAARAARKLPPTESQTNYIAVLCKRLDRPFVQPTNRRTASVMIVRLQRHEDQLSTPLERLGMETYVEYLQSERWHSVRKRYREKLPLECFACGNNRHIQIHHKRYDNLGREEINDLVALCQRCHFEVHELVNLGKATLSSAPNKLRLMKRIA